ncbi:UNVERIFIED_CONTAM: hypothetical protein NCL1_47935 [Trichonephila clavipes]
MSGKEQKNPTSEEPHQLQLLQPAQGAEGGSESTSTETSPQGSSKKKWKNALLKYSPTGKSSKTKSKSEVSPKDEQTDIKERSSRSNRTSFQKFAERARNLAGRKSSRDLKDNLCENEEREVHEDKESTRKRLSSIPKQVESSIDPSKCKQHQLTDSSSVASMPTSSISLGSSPFSSEPASPKDEVATSDDF